MKLKIESWVQNNNFSENINLLFRDAIVCYKSGANRASLLFSYLGFLTILKERMLDANRPALFPEGQWNETLRKSRNEDEWEKTIFEATQIREKYVHGTTDIEKDAIFAINENLRLQILYWKDRRNDCAHFKHNAIEGHHVESFWSFIQSNLPKITVEGGMQTLLNKIRDHFNTTLTAPEKDCDYLVKQIETSIDTFKLGEFWKTFLTLGEYEFDMGNSRKTIIARSFEINSPNANEPLVKILKDEKHLRRSFLNSFPEKIGYLNMDDQQIRKFWQIEIHDMHNSLKTYVALLRNNLIPPEEIPASNEKMALNLKSYDVEPHEQHILVVSNFFDQAKKYIFDGRKFEDYLWVNGKADLIAGIIKNHPADKEIITRLCYVYGLSTNSNWLLERLDNILTSEAVLTAQYKAIIAENGIEVPPKLEKYFK